MNQQVKQNAGTEVLPSHGGRALDNSCPTMIGLSALQALYHELVTYPKPGLVSPVDNGSHPDMDASLFFRSLFSLRRYFCDIARAGQHNASFDMLRRLGIAAEKRMMKATRGINTHRGAIFNLGLLAAAAGRLRKENLSLQEDALGAMVKRHWGKAIQNHGQTLPKVSHGSQVASRYGVGGALQEASSGFPHVFAVGLPALQSSLARGADAGSAAVQCLFSLMKVLADTNLLYRGGETGLSYAQDSARSFLAAGGIHCSGWHEHAVAIHREFVNMKLSPGGSADLLAATLFVNRLQS